MKPLQTKPGTFGHALRTARGDITREALARAANVASGAIYSLEAGKYQPSLDTALGLAGGLAVLTGRDARAIFAEIIAEMGVPAE